MYPFGRGGSRASPYLLLLPGLALYLLVALGPSLATIVYSLTDTNGLTPAPLQFIGLDNYQEFLFKGAAARQNIDALLRTVVFCVVVTVVQFTAGAAGRGPAQPAAARHQRCSGPCSSCRSSWA